MDNTALDGNISEDDAARNRAEAMELARLREENAFLKAKIVKKQHAPSCKVSEKGGLSVYGLGRFPVTLYKSQWLRLLDYVDTIRAFIEANGHLLKDKAE